MKSSLDQIFDYIDKRERFRHMNEHPEEYGKGNVSKVVHYDENINEEDK